MTDTTVELTLLDLTIATGLVVVAGMASLLMRLGIERRLLVASLRTVIQLLIIGYVLKWVFRINTPWALVPVVFVMIFMASRAAVQRSRRRYTHATSDTFVTLVFCGLFTTAVVTQAVIGVQPWYKPQYVIPLLGMILGNGLTGISLCLDVLLEQFSEQQAIVEMELAHGATRWEAARDALQEAIRRGMIPIINSMSVVGLVALPGMMTGQILAGNPPLQAVKYQIVVMFMIAASTSLGCIGTALLAYRRLFNAKHQLRYRLIQEK